MRRLTALCILVIPVVVIAASRPAPQELSAEDVAAIQKLLTEDWERLLVADDMEGLLAQFTDQAIEIFRNETSNVGISNIRRRWQVFRNYDYTEYQAEVIDITGYKDTAAAFIKPTFTAITQEGAEPTTVEDVWLFILKKKEGAWKIAVVHWVNV